MLCLVSPFYSVSANTTRVNMTTRESQLFLEKLQTATWARTAPSVKNVRYVVSNTSIYLGSCGASSRARAVG